MKLLRFFHGHYFYFKYQSNIFSRQNQLRKVHDNANFISKIDFKDLIQNLFSLKQYFKDS